MATGPTLYVTEFPAVLTTAAPLAAFPSFGTQVILLGSVDNTIILGASTYLIKMLANSDCIFDIQTSPQSHCPLSANVPEFYSVQPGQRLSARQR
jgi:hypothetical protein